MGEEVSNWLGFSTPTSDDVALRVAAARFDVDVEELELERDGGCVKVRAKCKLLSIYRTEEVRQATWLKITTTRDAIRGPAYGDDCNVLTLAKEYLHGLGWTWDDGSDLAVIEMLLNECIKLERLVIACDSDRARFCDEGGNDDDTMAAESSDGDIGTVCDNIARTDSTQSQP